MKALKIVGLVILSVIALLVVVGLIMPKEISSERSIVIDAPRDVVFAHMKDLQSTHEWSPWMDMDPEAKVIFEGTPGAVGSKMTWDGEEVGNGSQEITSIEPGERIDFQLHFFDWDAKPKAYLILDDAEGEEGAEGGTKVTWGFVQDAPFPYNLMYKAMNMTGMIAKDYDKGLAKLDKLVKEGGKEEPVASAPAKFDIKEMEMAERKYIGRRDVVKWADMEAYFTEHYGAIGQLVQTQSLEMGGAPSALYYMWDWQNEQADLAAVFPVANPSGDLGGYKVFTAPAGKYAVIDYYGAYEGLEAPHNALTDYLKGKGYGQGLVVEEYMTDPETEKDPSKVLTKIYYEIKQ